MPACLASYVDEEKENNAVEPEAMDVDKDGSNVSAKPDKRKYLVDTTGIHVPKPGNFALSHSISFPFDSMLSSFF